MKSLVISLFVLLSFRALAQNTLTVDSTHQPPPANIEEVAWIAGHWKGEAFGGVIEEVWTPPLGNSMMCSFKLVVEGEVDFYELVTIREKEESLVLQLRHFDQDLKAWEEKEETLDFPLVKLVENKAFFNGFTFEKISDEELNVYVLFNYEDENAKEMKFNYHLERP